jgi:hypothetical protein
LDAGNPSVRLDERDVETEHRMRLLTHRRENPDPEYAEAYTIAPPLDPARRFPERCVNGTAFRKEGEGAALEANPR